MTPERWRQITAIFHGVRNLDAARRPALLDQMCGEDASLRAEVESMLASYATAAGDGRVSLSIEVMPQLTPGSSFGAYRVDALVGAGGMGQVYRATDTRLRRTVAIKVLPPGFSEDPDFDARFEREARLLAALSHPNIAAIHGLEEAGGVQGLVLEFVEGPTLAERLATGRLPVPEALGIAKQIALALEAAHEKSIIHRDLKPANVKITPNGVVKVLDFGIAKVADGARSMLTTASGTDTGIILGTPAYMSPEQARGLIVDKRTDVWAFGCVLFEMLTGRGAFAGNTASDSLAKVIEREPDWSALPAAVPQPIRRLIARCLQKQPSERLHDIADARIEIREAIAQPVRADSPDTRSTRRSSAGRAAIVTGAVGALIFIGFLAWHAMTSREAPTSPAAFMETGITFPNNFYPAYGVSVSPDGRYAAVGLFANSAQIWLHSFDGNVTRPLEGGDGGFLPFWSPDSKKVAFFRGTNLVTVGISGGSPTFVTALPIGLPTVGAGGTWSRDDVILVAVQNKLYRVAASGGTASEVPVVGAGQVRAPAFLPDGQHFVFFAYRRGGGAMQLGSLDSDRVTTLVESDNQGAFAPPDRLLFVRRATLMSQRLDMNRFVPIGAAEPVASGVVHGMVPDITTVWISASSTGLLAVSSPRGGSSGRLEWFTRDGRQDGAIAPLRGDTEYLNPALSPNGTQVAMTVVDPGSGTSDIWMFDAVRNEASQLTNDPASESDPVWSPDGTEIAYASNRDGRLGLFRKSVAGGPPVPVIDLSEYRNALPTDWSRSGYLLYQTTVGRWSIWALPLSGGGTPFLPLDDQTSQYSGHLSPDGQWIAYNTSASGQFEVWVQRFRTDGPRKQISHGGGVHPRWTREGKELVYWSPPGGVLANDISITGSDIGVGPTRTLLDRPVLSLIDGRTHYDITRDGRRLLVRQPFGPPRPAIRVIVNWMSKITK